MHGRREQPFKRAPEGKRGISLGKVPLAPFEKIYVEDQGGMPGRRPPLIAPQITVFTFGRHTRVGTHSPADFLTRGRKI